jgi:hypothetical protein
VISEPWRYAAGRLRAWGCGIISWIAIGRFEGSLTWSIVMKEGDRTARTGLHHISMPQMQVERYQTLACIRVSDVRLPPTPRARYFRSLQRLVRALTRR